MAFTPHSRVRMTVLVLALVALVGTSACTYNAATGRRQLSLISEQQEIAMGMENDKAIQAQLGLYPDEELQTYIHELGTELAAVSERPSLPWQFRVVDDPAVNAFALPGGYIYVTRGILAHFNSEAELASVLGHEIGHVTARHSVEQMSRAQLAQLGLGIAMIASEEARQYADIASMGLQMLFLKFGRDDEDQSDDLGLRYMSRTGHAVSEMPGVFEMLDRQTELQGGQRIPEWQSTHPYPAHRAQRIAAQVAAMPAEQRGEIVRREEYLRHLDGLVFGANPREGYTVGNVFYHPEMAFKLNFPKDWTVHNQKQSVIAVSPEEDAIVVLSLAEGSNPGQAAEAFFSRQGIERGDNWRRGFYGFRTTPQTNQQTGSSNYLRGVVGFVPINGRVFQLLGYSDKEGWNKRREPLKRSVVSMKKLTEKRFLDVHPAEIELVKLSRPMTLRQFNQQRPSNLKLEALAVLNGVGLDERLPKGTTLKRVVGGKLPGK